MLRNFCLAFIIILVFLLPGCSFSTPTADEVPTITIAGSTSMLPISDTLARYYQKKHPGICVNVQGWDSTIGMHGVVNEIVDIGALSRALTPDEQKKLNQYIIAKDELSVIIHPQNPVEKVDIAQIGAIYSGEITNWKQLGGANKAISVISREEGSGTHSIFEDLIISGNTKITENAAIMPSTGAVKAAVARDKYAVGYISSNYLSQEVKNLLIIKENKEFSSLVRPLVFVTQKRVDAHTMEFLEFAVSSEAQKLIKNF